MAEKTNAVHLRTLQRAAAILGGKEKLREHLRVPLRNLEAWLAGTEALPMAVFLKAVDVVAKALPRPASALRRSQDLHRAASAAIEQSRRVMEQASDAQANARAARAAYSTPEFLSGDFSRSKGGEVLHAALDAAMHATHADMGNVQLASAEGLLIVAQRGFERPFLEFFAAATADDRSIAGRAMKAGRCVVVPDVAADLALAASDAGAVMQAAGARAAQSTPMVAASGWTLGVISTHFREPRTPSDDELSRVDAIARRAAFWLEKSPRP
jgi:hypothetical protein